MVSGRYRSVTAGCRKKLGCAVDLPQNAPLSSGVALASGSRSMGQLRFAPPHDPASAQDGPDLVEQLAAMARDGDHAGAWRLVEQARHEKGSALEVLGSLLTPAARKLEAWWAEDRCTSVEVMVGTCKLRTLALNLVSAASGETEVSFGRTAFVWAPSGDRLGFESTLHECSLELIGWNVETLEGLPTSAMLRRARTTRVDLAVCALDDERRVKECCQSLRHLRRASGNPSLRVLGVGRGFASCQVKQGCPLDGIMSAAEDTMAYARALERPDPAFLPQRRRPNTSSHAETSWA